MPSVFAWSMMSFEAVHQAVDDRTSCGCFSCHPFGFLGTLLRLLVALKSWASLCRVVPRDVPWNLDGSRVLFPDIGPQSSITAWRLKVGGAEPHHPDVTLSSEQG